MDKPNDDSQVTLLSPNYNKPTFTNNNVQLDTLKITMLDLSQLSEGLNESYFQGEIPSWVEDFKNLRVLKACNIGIIYLDDWLLNLTELRELYLDDNMITTWPYFLLKHHTLEHLSLSGNPCVEQQAIKSPTFQSLFLGYKPNNNALRTLPQTIRGPEWQPAASARSGVLADVQGMGFYTGGIYTLSTEVDYSNDGYVTCPAPCPLQQRLDMLAKGVDPRLHTGEHIDTTEVGTSPKMQPGLTPGGTPGLFPAVSPAVSPGLSPAGTPHSSYLDDNLLRVPTLNLNDNDHFSVDAIRRDSFNRNRNKNKNKTRNSGDSNLSWLVKPKTPTYFNPQPDFGLASTNPEIKLAVSKRKKGQSKIIREIFEDIVHLQARDKYKTDHELYKYVPLVGNDKSSYNQLPIQKGVSFGQDEMNTLVQQLREDEDKYVAALGQINHKYFRKYKHRKKSTYVKNILRALDFVPELYELHSRFIYPAIHGFARTLNSDNNTLCANSLKYLSVHLNSLKPIYQRISNQLCDAELALGSNDTPMMLYRDEVVAIRIHSRVNRLKRIGSYIQTVSSRNINSKNINSKNVDEILKQYGTNLDYSTDSDDQQLMRLSRSSTLLKHVSWLKDKLTSSKSSGERHPLQNLYLPLIRLVQYERLFTTFYGVDKNYSDLLKILRIIRKNCAMVLQSSRQIHRANLLEGKFKLRAGNLSKYQWDVLLAVQTRAYLEPGKVKYKSNDVIDSVSGEPKSLVKEIFSPDHPRYLRLVSCEDVIFLYDEVYEAYIGELTRDDIIAIPSDHSQVVRVVFPSVAETCIAKVVDFTAAYLTSENYRQEFMDALRVENTLLS